MQEAAEIFFAYGVYVNALIHIAKHVKISTGSGGYRGGGGGQTRPMPPLTNKDTPPVHCNEFNYMSSAPHCFSSCRR